MTDRKRKILIWLGVIALVLIVFVLWVMRGNPSDLDPMATTGKDPLLVEADSEFIPSVGLVKLVGWGNASAPTAANGLVVNRFAEGLAHPRTLYKR